MATKQEKARSERCLGGTRRLSQNMRCHRRRWAWDYLLLFRSKRCHPTSIAASITFAVLITPCCERFMGTFELVDGAEGLILDVKVPFPAHINYILAAAVSLL